MTSPPADEETGDPPGDDPAGSKPHAVLPSAEAGATGAWERMRSVLGRPWLWLLFAIVALAIPVVGFLLEIRR